MTIEKNIYIKVMVCFDIFQQLNSKASFQNIANECFANN